MTYQFHSTVLREYDIRGIIGETLGPDDARAIGRGFGTLLRRSAEGGRRSKVAVSYDGRVSSPILEHALVEGLTSSGVDVARPIVPVTRRGHGAQPLNVRAKERTPAKHHLEAIIIGGIVAAENGVRPGFLELPRSRYRHIRGVA